MNKEDININRVYKIRLLKPTCCDGAYLTKDIYKKDGEFYNINDGSIAYEKLFEIYAVYEGTNLSYVRELLTGKTIKINHIVPVFPGNILKLSSSNKYTGIIAIEVGKANSKNVIEYLNNEEDKEEIASYLDSIFACDELAINTLIEEENQNVKKLSM